ncbi:hypothetical protein PGT21_035593 [Puccinia graminis f. sp. tritici]|uniref:Phosphatidylinositol N-acetylglucosaminyltransferase subunit H conserved domain-containing protein n=1 Tax=Puccinia graminis f. sp. tritici TaxID=56615 RepID=A0A5B0PF62_PUCGR|nr:hypothetical protein PGT21_035593 [Puccinia graminis f. sp. tritici]KAA1100306.1 hypothetical protein PGTUg99_013013 [Puccinia graminis f. sp. tritici]
MQPSSSREWTLTIQHLGPTTRLYSLHSNRPVIRIYQDALIIGTISVLITCMTWPSLPALILLIFAIACIYSKLTKVYSESVLILGPLGIQFSSTNLVRVTRRFVAREHIRQAIIHEAIVGWDIAFYLGLIIQPDGAPMYIRQVFNHLQPPVKYLVTVWKGIREILFQEEIHRVDHTDNSPLGGVTSLKLSADLEENKPCP